jgi:hypothetical protein
MVIITPSVEIIMGGKKKDERKISQKISEVSARLAVCG